MIRRLIDSYAAGDPLNPSDANGIAFLSREWQRLYTIQHNDDGTHNALRVPKATGVFTVSGGVYSRAASSGLVTSNGVGGWRKLAVGNLEITLSENMDSTHYGVDVCPFKVESGPVFWNEDADGFAKTIKTFRIKLWTASADADCGFVVNVYGLKA